VYFKIDLIKGIYRFDIYIYYSIDIKRSFFQLNRVASSILDGSFNNTQANLARYGMISHSRENDGTLNVGEAKELFAEWYDQEENYNYCNEPNDTDAGKFMI